MPLQDDIRNLSRLAPFRDLEADALRLIALSAETHILRAGDVLFREGDRSDSGYIVLSGKIALTSGKRPAVIVGPPVLLGAAALLTETERPATAQAGQPASVLQVPRDLYRRVLTAYPGSAVRVRRNVAAQLLALQDDYEGLRLRLAG